MFNIIYNDRKSLDMGLVVEKKPIVPTPQRKIQYIEIPGRSGSLTVDENAYEDISIPMVFCIEKGTKINIREVKAWLLERKDISTLEMSDSTDSFYRVKNIQMGNIDRSIRTMAKFEVTFIVEPFEYLKTGNEIMEFNKSIEFYNEGTYESEPKITIYGTGSMYFYLNYQKIALSNVEGEITIDTEIMECHKNGISMNHKMIGDFPVLRTGRNTIILLGDMKMEITPRWRCI